VSKRHEEAELVAEPVVTDLRRQLTDLISEDETETWSRLDPLIEALSDTPESGIEVERLAAMGSFSRTLTATVAAHPEIVGGDINPEWSVPLQNSAALLGFATAELAGLSSLADATNGYSRFIDHLMERTLAAARLELRASHPIVEDLPFAVIAMGKWGANELNYASDIDLMFVHGDNPENSESYRGGAIALASRLIAKLTASSFEGPGLVLDADLRPEGSMGPLSRRLDAYASYYQRWAEPWELQALIKSRPAAGDPDLGQRFASLAAAVVWEHGIDVEAIRGLRRLKSEAESQAHPSDLKRAPGGIRDVEFTVQLLQLVHGRHDPKLRLRGTLDALSALEDGSYLSLEEADELRAAYLTLRRLEHLIQIWDVRQTHRVPSDPEARRRLAIGMGLGRDPEELTGLISTTRAATRTLHERIYFRPILDSLVGSPSARLGPENAYERLSALGFANTRAAAEALEALTTGLSRKSRAMQQMMPLMLDWLSLSPQPDLGLSQLRVLLANTTDHSTLVARLLNNPVTGERLAMLLGTGRLFGDLLDRIPEFIPRLADDTALDDIRGREAAIERLMGLLASRPGRDAQVGTIRR
jgi:glutamate-ammonia-ligase adenylyltransferase